MADDPIADALASIRARFLPGAYPMLEIRPGWYPIIIDLDRKLSAIDPSYQLVQVKEKFGGLRYYVEFEPDRTRPGFGDLIRAAERRSERTCEECGAEGAPSHRGSWARTLCAADAAASGFVPDTPTV
ncbi:MULTISPECIES: hypothetical protein [Tsukamurella]|uniref:Uncharacterized protein n=2 Tax=Tsukamurella TaxID=2060 RepID=A0A1H1AS33_9ACTN|nr:MULTISPECIES: hypothetical protein [Tsukamurella]KXO92879.1 hypothetical protein AXK56_22500 [Tsukamurella pulmonis]KXP14158.1 hypothetical protein AXK60_22020 [Tsukamurella pseudospumae]SDQ42454.1 hypothetical protein SAMN04489765_0361 [Tsukamurella pulmonis]SUP26186.1 Uncharacterised protein [Tsukamurella pulmonis]